MCGAKYFCVLCTDGIHAEVLQVKLKYNKQIEILNMQLTTIMMKETKR